LKNKNYVLIVVDEIERILSHFDAKTLKKNENTCDILTRLLKETNEKICLDGDIYYRSLDFLENKFQFFLIYYKKLKKK
jgi:hypothetical protein